MCCEITGKLECKGGKFEIESIYFIYPKDMKMVNGKIVMKRKYGDKFPRTIHVMEYNND